MSEIDELRAEVEYLRRQNMGYAELARSYYKHIQRLIRQINQLRAELRRRDEEEAA